MIERKDMVVSVLRMLSAAILNKEKEKQYKLSREAGEPQKASLSDEETVDVIAGEIKKIKDSIVLFEKGQRADLVKKAREEIGILQAYLPEQMTEEEVKALVEETIAKTGASSIKDMGKVMAGLMPKVRGKADAGLVSRIVKESLGQ